MVVAGVSALTFWLTAGILSGVLLGGALGLFFLMATGRLALDLGWGRSLHPLGPMVVRVAAPRDLVYEMLRAPYAGRVPEGSGVEVLERGEDVVVAAHHTRVHFYTARTVEAVRFEPPDRITFRHLASVVPHGLEEFRLREDEGGTALEYRGEVGVDFWILGRLAGRHWVRPQWERAVRRHLEGLRERAEERASRRAAREARRASGTPSPPP